MAGLMRLISAALDERNEWLMPVVTDEQKSGIRQLILDKVPDFFKMRVFLWNFSLQNIQRFYDVKSDDELFESDFS